MKKLCGKSLISISRLCFVVAPSCIRRYLFSYLCNSCTFPPCFADMTMIAIVKKYPQKYKHEYLIRDEERASRMSSVQSAARKFESVIRVAEPVPPWVDL